MARPPIRYEAEICGSSFGYPHPQVNVSTLRECRAWAESYGTTADYCLVFDSHRRLVARYQRDTSGAGTRWFRAEP
jgi:hypothetical protein